MITSPMEQAFALIGHDGFDGASTAVATGIRQAAHRDEDAVNAWIAIGACLNHIVALNTRH